jgi:hypothetical protein
MNLTMLLDMATIWLAFLAVLLQLCDVAPELPWHDCFRK